MDSFPFSRRGLFRKGFAWIGGTLVWGSLRATLQGSEAITGQTPKTAAEALAELKAGNQRYVTGSHLHHDLAPNDSRSLAASIRLQ